MLRFLRNWGGDPKSVDTPKFWGVVTQLTGRLPKIRVDFKHCPKKKTLKKCLESA